MRRHQHDFSEPGRGRGSTLRRGLDTHRSISDTSHRCLLEGMELIFPSQRGTFLSLFATGEQLVAHRVGNANLKTTFSSQKNEYDQELTRVEATLGMRGAGASLLTSTPPIPWRAQLEHCEKEERAADQGDGGLQARSGEWEAGECG